MIKKVKIEKLILKTKAIDNLLLAPMERAPQSYPRKSANSKTKKVELNSFTKPGPLTERRRIKGRLDCHLPQPFETSSSPLPQTFQNQRTHAVKSPDWAPFATPTPAPPCLLNVHITAPCIHSVERFSYKYLVGYFYYIMNFIGVSVKAKTLTYSCACWWRLS